MPTSANTGVHPEFTSSRDRDDPVVRHVVTSDQSGKLGWPEKKTQRVKMSRTGSATYA